MSPYPLRRGNGDAPAQLTASPRITQTISLCQPLPPSHLGRLFRSPERERRAEEQHSLNLPRSKVSKTPDTFVKSKNLKKH